MGFFGLTRPKCDNCGHKCGYMLHQGWRHSDYPGYVFGRKKCLVGYIRKNPKVKNRIKQTAKIATNYPLAGSKGKYSNIWRNELATISEILSSSAPSGNITLNFEDFALVGNRQSYSFNLEFCDGTVSNNISGSSVARDLAAVLTSSSKIKSAIQYGNFKFQMDKNFTLWVSRIG